jgi:hypothetical protein
MGKYLSDTFSTENVLKRGGVLSLVLFNLYLEEAIRKIQESQPELKLNGTHELPAHAEDVNPWGIKKKKTDALMEASKEVATFTRM